MSIHKTAPGASEEKEGAVIKDHLTLMAALAEARDISSNLDPVDIVDGPSEFMDRVRQDTENLRLPNQRATIGMFSEENDDLWVQVELYSGDTWEKCSEYWFGEDYYLSALAIDNESVALVNDCRWTAGALDRLRRQSGVELSEQVIQLIHKYYQG